MKPPKRYLSDVKQGEKVYILKVKGYGAFRKRITEMGFIQGTVVTVIKKSPLQDPIEYKLMNYHVSLRKSEAALIEVISLEESKKQTENETFNTSFTLNETETPLYSKGKEKEINIALVGNPNCGKTTLFNLATNRKERVGNYGGVTVDLKTASFKQDDYEINMTDLPGTYSISEYTPEELYVREHLSETMPDVVVNVIDSSNIERNLFLTTQLIDMNIRVVIVLNMYDELTKNGGTLDHKLLAKLLGCPIVPMVASKRVGLAKLISTIIDTYEGKDEDERHIHISYGNHINKALYKLSRHIKSIDEIADRYHSRYVAIKLLEDDKQFTALIQSYNNGESVIKLAKLAQTKLEKEFKEASSTLIADAKYSFIRGALKETYEEAPEKNNKSSYAADVILTSKWFGFPVFLLAMWATFQLTFTLGSYPMEWIDQGVRYLAHLLEPNMAEGILKDLIINGILEGVGGVIIFLPNILILFFCISLMEDTGYMARFAFMMDKLMHRIGLHGKSFIPLLMGFGCNVPAIMATRTLENRKDRIITMLIIPFMSCSARLPVYLLLTSIFFVQYQSLMLLSIYITGIVIAAVTSLILSKFFFKKQDVPFVMELPPYRLPSIRNTAIHMWTKAVQYLSKMGGIILIASIIIWALGYFPQNKNIEVSKTQIDQIANNEQLNETERNTLKIEIESQQASVQLENSYIGKIGHAIEPVISPLGFDWKIGVSLITGLAAKEIVVSTMNVLYNAKDKQLREVLKKETHQSGSWKGEKVYTPLVAYSLMLFILIYFPCVAVIAAIRKELGWRWASFTVIYTTTVAWLISFAVFQIGQLF